MRPLPVLVTRPRAEAVRLAAQLRELGAEVVVLSPLMRIEGLGQVPPLQGGVLLTSGNALTTFIELGGVPGGPAWVVGARTADRARAAGFDVRGVAPDVDGLVPLVPPNAPQLLHLRGEVTRGDLTGRLRERGLAVTEAVIYRQIAQGLSNEAHRILRAGPVLIPLYSPRSAALLGQAAPPDVLANLRLLALSPAVAEACPIPPVATAQIPDGKGMLSLIQTQLAAICG